MGIVMDSKKKRVSFKKYLKIDKSKLNDLLTKHPENVYTIGRKIEILWEEISDKELQLDEKEAKLAAQTRNKYSRREEKLSETAIKDIVKANPEITELKAVLKKLRKTYRLAKLRKETLAIKLECMTIIAHNVRADKKNNSDLSTRV